MWIECWPAILMVDTADPVVVSVPGGAALHAAR
jgi:hypothetical protein